MDERSGASTVDCPVCDASGSVDGIDPHLRYDHGWGDLRVRLVLDSLPGTDSGGTGDGRGP